MKLSHDQSRRLRRGDCTSLDFPFDHEKADHGRPTEPGVKVVLDWEPERRLWDEGSGQIVTVPEEPVLWVEVTAVMRHRKGHWRVQLSVTDHRHKSLYLGAGGAYTTSRFRAIDDLEVIPPKDLERMAKVAYERDQSIRLERVAAGRVAKTRFRRERQHAMRRLSATA